MGSVSDTYKYFSAMDCFILPSLYEGLPVAGIEAQASGLKCFFSDNITSEAKISKYTEFLSIEEEKECIKKIIESKKIKREETNNNLYLDNYSIDLLANKLYCLYTKILERNNKL